jgi:hypothetical protein
MGMRLAIDLTPASCPPRAVLGAREDEDSMNAPRDPRARRGDRSRLRQSVARNRSVLTDDRIVPTIGSAFDCSRLVLWYRVERGKEREQLAGKR